jgi:hypothetical protein
MPLSTLIQQLCLSVLLGYDDLAQHCTAWIEQEELRQAEDLHSNRYLYTYLT